MSITAVPIAPVRRAYWLWLVAGILLAVIAAAALAVQSDDFLAKNARKAGVVTTVSGLQYKVLARGAGAPKPTDADVALVNYEGKLLNGTTFDKSAQPTPLPVSGVVPGFSEGLKLMSKGAKYRFWIKPALGYGPEAKGPIPANSTLSFDVELVDFLPEATVRQLQMQQQMMGGGMPGAPARR